MRGQVLEIDDLSAAVEEMRKLGVDAVGIELMAPKALLRVVKISQVKPTAANILKQEMLSIGGEVATAYGSINQSIDAADLLIIGTLKQIGFLIEKLKRHQFGLPQLAEEIKTCIERYQSCPVPIKPFEFGKKTYVMGVLNVTPDSFSDGNQFFGVEEAVGHAKAMLENGADIIDIGGESTRPGAKAVGEEEEKKRVLPVVERLAAETGVVLSIDTRKAGVAKAALQAGAHLINDTSGLRFDPKMKAVAAESGCPVVMMHMQGTPENMQKNPTYHDLMGDIINYLEEGLEIGTKAGILLEKIIVDPGIGFGKTVQHNLEILRKLKALKVLGRPIMVGVSRKAFIGHILGLPENERVEGTAAASAIAISNGADFVRVHDVKELQRVVKITDAIVRDK